MVYQMVFLHFGKTGSLLSNHNNILWANTESQSRGWNHVWLGGNNINTYGDEYEPWKKLHEQWYAIDDFIISTDYIGPDNLPPTKCFVLNKLYAHLCVVYMLCL